VGEKNSSPEFSQKKDNLGQMSEAVGFKDAHIFVSLTSIWNFLGRIGVATSLRFFFDGIGGVPPY
jgi:hypothetical protein